jgi:hypothetical protein
MNLISKNQELILTTLKEDCSSLVLLPKIDELINKQDPTLEDILEICSHNEFLLQKLTRRGGFGTDSEEFAKEILFKKGLSFLKSLAIRTMNQEIFKLPLELQNMSETILKRRSVILARFTKHYYELLELKPDDAYLCGLFYNLSYVSYEKLVVAKVFNKDNFEEFQNDSSHFTAEALCDIGFDNKITSFVADSVKDLFSTSFPLGHALTRIGNGLLIHAEQSSLSSSAGIDRNLLDATGLTTREIINVMKVLTRDYKGGTHRQ